MKKDVGSNNRNAPLLIIASCYNLVALAGTLLGMRYYLPTPPMLSDRLIMNDLRYGGALCGALIGAALVSLIVPGFTMRFSSRSTVPVVLSSTAGLAFFLLQENPRFGTITIIALLIPWLIALTLNRRFAAHELRSSPQRASLNSKENSKEKHRPISNW